MKKTLLTLALVAMTSVAAYSQGTIAFGNSALTRVTVLNADGTLRGNAKASDSLIIGVFFGAENATDPAALHQANGTATIGATDGVLANAPSVFQLAGTNPGDIVSLQIRAWNTEGTLYGESRIINTFQLAQDGVTKLGLGPTAGPGYVIWQTASSVNPQRLTPLIVHVVPEPSTIALGILGIGSLLLFRRRK